MTPYGRTAQESVRRALKTFRVVLITGPRQAGKTTLARLLGEGRPRRTFVSLDDLTALSSAKSDPQGFIRNLSLPVTIDEIQRAPDLLLPIKRQVDERRRPGDFLLTGSADPLAVQSVKESLAGRMAMIPLRPLTWAERLKRPEWNPLARILKCRTAKAVVAAFPASPYEATRLDREVLMGGFPEPAIHIKPAHRGDWYQQYIRTYLDRDVAFLMKPDDDAVFLRYLRLVASASGTLLNLSRFARDAGLSVDTARRWLSVLQATFFAETIPPYWRNVRKRLVKSPKIHVSDTGLAAALIGLDNWKQAQQLNLAGPLTESWIHHHVQAYAAGMRPEIGIRFFRSVSGEECDLALEAGSRLIPIEIKATQTPTNRDTGGLEVFLKLFKREAPFGLLLYPGTQVIPMGERVIALPMRAFLQP